MFYVYVFVCERPEEEPFNIARLITGKDFACAFDRLKTQVENSPHGEFLEDYECRETITVLGNGDIIATVFNNEIILGSGIICGRADQSPGIKMKPAASSNFS